MYEGPGIYQHYKGGYYRVLGVAKHESTGAKTVIYHSYDIEHDMGRWMEFTDFVARPLNIDDGSDSFNSEVIVGQHEDYTREVIPRFVKVHRDY
jgi:hypothetical protein